MASLWPDKPYVAQSVDLLRNNRGMIQLAHGEFLELARRTQRLRCLQNLEAFNIILVFSRQVLLQQLDQLWVGNIPLNSSWRSLLQQFFLRRKKSPLPWLSADSALSLCAASPVFSRYLHRSEEHTSEL